MSRIFADNFISLKDDSGTINVEQFLIKHGRRFLHRRNRSFQMCVHIIFLIGMEITRRIRINRQRKDRSGEVLFEFKCYLRLMHLFIIKITIIAVKMKWKHKFRKNELLISFKGCNSGRWWRSNKRSG